MWSLAAGLQQVFGDHDPSQRHYSRPADAKGVSHDVPVIAILGRSKIRLDNMEQSGERPHNC